MRISLSIFFKQLTLLPLMLLFFSGNLNGQNLLQTGLAVTEKEQFFLNHIEQSIINADLGISKLNPSILSLEGFSSKKGRHLLNNLCSLPGAFYLEIGCWKGSTFISALYGNQNSIIDAVGLDNWSEAGGPKKEFLHNCKRYLPTSPYRFYSVDCFAINKSDYFTQPVNIYFYDGEHSSLAHELALTYYDEVMDDLFILVIDDWNWENVKNGTLSGLAQLNYTILYSRELPARFTGDSENWWNGMLIALIRKNK